MRNTFSWFKSGFFFCSSVNQFVKISSSVPESCYPFSNHFGYEEGEAQPRDDESCLIPRHRRTKVPERFAQCPAMKGRRGLYRTQPAYKVGRRNTREHPKRREHDIMFEILTHGPVQGMCALFAESACMRQSIAVHSYATHSSS